MVMARKKGENISPPLHTHMHERTEKAAQREGEMERCGGSTSPCAIEFFSIARERGSHKERRNGRKGEREIERERERARERERETRRTIRREKNLPLLPLMRVRARKREERSRRKIEREEEKKEKEEGEKIFSPSCAHARVCEEKRETTRGANLFLYWQFRSRERERERERKK